MVDLCAKSVFVCSLCAKVCKVCAVIFCLCAICILLIFTVLNNCVQSCALVCSVFLARVRERTEIKKKKPDTSRAGLPQRKLNQAK